ncbi:TraR/DksA family transcriptional regulator [Sandaracinus amylolyticus]|uniref:C4-type zinc finger protein, DksA/TraR family n=1 Tax=Sandaracinus amylolyticus TaxID=927083 RepID=A0A0F6WA42_9BACT|nr:TraR/DksA C4-type zinc finger protein [Sandaracinus amylolyticus]AKF11286.1 C4-type zinc finger protein, DksA/TraR family [Sandaracinus amylolyticus]
MAKARTTEKSGAKKTAATTTTKASASERPAKPAAKPAAAAAPAVEKPAAKPAPAKTERSAAGTMSNNQPIPDASQVRAHPDAKLSTKEIQSLYQKLIDERNRVLSGFDRHVSEALEDGDVLADEIDIAQRSTDQAWLFRFADKERKLLIEIEAALEKMRSGEYGLCEGTDEPIGFKRLELRPWTRYSVGYKELLEREKAQHTR